ncbi:hypothetical protein HMPREF0277_0899 [Corynebacterium accolens ATCC 49726]|nr:hypothetical protein HMPREF0277_0899 [Corynebacterium accolens ATCC 49726]
MRRLLAVMRRLVLPVKFFAALGGLSSVAFRRSIIERDDALGIGSFPTS